LFWDTPWKYFLNFLVTVFWIIATDALSEVSDGFGRTAADLGNFDGPDYHQFLQSESKHYSSEVVRSTAKNTALSPLYET
jgi:hypothetical protein